MSPEDARHGSYAGAVQHWMDGERTCDPCRLAGNRSRKRRKLAEHNGRPVQVDSGATVRRLRALQALGHPMPTVARLADLPVGTLHRLTSVRNPFVRRATAEAVEATYERLCMTVPVGRYVKRDRARAVAKGWLPPLAWLDIEAGVVANERIYSDVDPVVVDRILAGDMTLAKTATRAERTQVVARWRADGRSMAELERLAGWKTERYATKEVA